MSYSYGLSAVLLSQNGFFTDKGGHCVVKCCCAITGWGSFSRGEWSVSADVSFTTRLRLWKRGRFKSKRCAFNSERVLRKQSTVHGETFICTLGRRLLSWLALATTVIRELWTVAKQARALCCASRCHIRSSGFLRTRYVVRLSIWAKTSLWWIYASAVALFHDAVYQKKENAFQVMHNVCQIRKVS